MALLTQKIAIANLALLLYYLSPNFSTFALTLLLLGLVISPQTLTQIFQSQQKYENSINSSFNAYLDTPITKKILVVAFAGLVAQLAYLLPSWLIVLLIAEVWASWELLVDYGIVELVETQVQSAEVSLKKLFEMIPRYQGQ